MVQIPRYIKVEVTGCMGMSARGPDLHISPQSPRRDNFSSTSSFTLLSADTPQTRRVQTEQGACLSSGEKKAQSARIPLTQGARRAACGPDARATILK